MVLEAPSEVSQKIYSIKKKQRFQIIEYEKEFYKVRHSTKNGETVTGYVFEIVTPKHPHLIDLKNEWLASNERNEVLAERQSAENVERAKEKLWQQQVALYGEMYAKFVKLGIPEVGMTESMLKEIMGYPHDIHTSIGSWGTYKQYVYNIKGYDYDFYYFENGKLTSWHK